MNLFSTPGSSLFTTIVIVIDVLSFLLMLVIIYEYRHVHQKRVDLVKELGEKPHAMYLERRLLILFYVISTVVVIVAPLSVYL